MSNFKGSQARSLGDSWNILDSVEEDGDAASLVSQQPPRSQRKQAKKQQSSTAAQKQTAIARSQGAGTVEQAVGPGSLNTSESLNGKRTPNPRTRSSGYSRAAASSRQVIDEPTFIMPSPSADLPQNASWFMASPGETRRRASQARAKRASSEGPEPPVKSRKNNRQKGKPALQRDDYESPAASSWPLSVLRWILSNLVIPIVHFALSVAGIAAGMLKPLFSLILVVLLVVAFIRFAILGSLFSAFESLGSITKILPDFPEPCDLPVISLLPFCGQVSTAKPEFEQLVTVQASVEDVLHSAAQGVTLPLEMKRSEAGIRDLRYLVQYSNLPSKHELVHQFEDFIATARTASAELTKFNSRIGRAVDHIISINKHTLLVLDGIESYESSRGAVGRFVSTNLPFLGDSALAHEQFLLQQYIKHTSRVEEQIMSLISEAQVLLSVLQSLDDSLDVIHGICIRDGISVQSSREDLLAQLWTKVGGNRKSVNQLNEKLSLLRDVSAYRKLAWAHVTGTILKLQSIAAGLEDLRDRVAQPELGSQDVPLLQHIETIQLGVRRLEEQRSMARRLEGEGYKKALDRAEGSADRLLDGKEL